MTEAQNPRSVVPSPFPVYAHPISLVSTPSLSFEGKKTPNPQSCGLSMPEPPPRMLTGNKRARRFDGEQNLIELGNLRCFPLGPGRHFLAPSLLLVSCAAPCPGRQRFVLFGDGRVSEGVNEGRRPGIRKGGGSCVAAAAAATSPAFLVFASYLTGELAAHPLCQAFPQPLHPRPAGSRCASQEVSG